MLWKGDFVHLINSRCPPTYKSPRSNARPHYGFPPRTQSGNSAIPIFGFSTLCLVHPPEHLPTTLTNILCIIVLGKNMTRQKMTKLSTFSSKVNRIDLKAL